MIYIKKIIFLILISSLITGCALINIKDQQQKAANFCQLKGTINTELDSNNGLIVVLFRHKEGAFDQKQSWSLVDHYTLDKPGQWAFYSSPGTYFLTAFQDINNNQIFERNEPAIPFNPKQKFTCLNNSNETNINLVIPHLGRIPGEKSIDISKLQVRTKEQQLNVSLGQALAVGEVIDLTDPRFSQENASKGLWRPFDFIWESKPGIYFLQQYDKRKTPVLFIHGINGSPAEFKFLIEHLDHSRFQPWVAYYPSGAKLKNIASHLNRTLEQLKTKHHFKNILLVAHSMGGLVTRSMILEQNKALDNNFYSLFVSISTPWNGHSAAKMTKYAPAAAYSWLDLSPDSQFLTNLFYSENGSSTQPLSINLPHHLIFTYLTGEADDGTISIESQLRLEAQEDATGLYGYLQSHTGILKNLKTSTVLNKILGDSIK